MVGVNNPLIENSEKAMDAIEPKLKDYFHDISELKNNLFESNIGYPSLQLDSEGSRSFKYFIKNPEKRLRGFRMKKKLVLFKHRVFPTDRRP